MPISLLLSDILANKGLRVVFQPIASLNECSVDAHEALIRGPQGSALEFPDALFEQASIRGLRNELELAAIECAIECIGAQRLPGRFFVNISGQTLSSLGLSGREDVIENWLKQHKVPPSKLVFEITEHERVTDIDALKRMVDRFVARGIGFALDDFGDGHSSLRLWAEIQPRYVKIDKFFTTDIHEVEYKQQTFKALLRLCEILGGTLIAEGIETQEQMRVLMDLGVKFGQGYFLGRPEVDVVTEAPQSAVTFLQESKALPLPNSSASVVRGLTAERLLIRAPAMEVGNTINDVLEVFLANPDLYALPVVQSRRPVGLINRRDFLERISRPFQRDLLGKKPCTRLMNDQPRLLERRSDVDDMIALLTSEDQRFLSEGIIITDEGRYLGIGTGEQLVRTVTEQRLEAARHANPLTFLPGNIPISEYIDKLLRENRPFNAAYCDLNHFKPFNDQYGYWRGDEMIRLCSRVLMSSVDKRLDFVGHVGGDDFIIVFQSADWVEKAEVALSEFNRLARGLFDQAEIERGGIESEDRLGRPSFFPLTTLSMGIVCSSANDFKDSEEVASAAALAKRQAKRMKRGLWVDGQSVPSIEGTERELSA